MFGKSHSLSLYILLLFVAENKAWRAVPANQAMYSARRQLVLQQEESNILDDYLPRTTVHSIYKFGWCAKTATAPQFLRKKSTIHFPTLESARANYVYLIEPKNTIRFVLQCVVLQIMVPQRYMLRRSRLPLYYCQGTAYYVMFDFVQRLDIHEFYLRSHLNMPADFIISFYHPEL